MFEQKITRDKRVFARDCSITTCGRTVTRAAYHVMHTCVLI